jgi:hypothetical protein
LNARACGALVSPGVKPNQSAGPVSTRTGVHRDGFKVADRREAVAPSPI